MTTLASTLRIGLYEPVSGRQLPVTACTLADGALRSHLCPVAGARKPMMTLRRFAPFLAIPLLAIPALWPLFVVGLTASADGMLHLLRLGLLDSHMRRGCSTRAGCPTWCWGMAIRC